METQELEKRQLFSNMDLKRLILPLVIEQVLAVTIGMADTVMVTSVGEAAVSGVSLVDSINFLFLQIFSALATGGAVVASQYIGRQDRENACTAAKQLVYATAALALILGIFSLTFNRGILNLIFGHIDQDVMRNAQIYFMWSAASYPFIAIYNAGAAVFRAMGDSRTPMTTSIIMNAINICGNALFIFVFKWGVAGAAIATLISRIVGAVTVMILLRNPAYMIYIIKLFKPEFKWPMVKNILRIGIPNGLENGMFQIGKLTVQSLIASFGTAAIAANAISNSIASFAIIPGSATGMSLITVVGQCTGADEYDQAVNYTKKLMKIGYMAIIGLNAVIFAGAGMLVNLFNLSREATDAAIEIVRFHSVCAAAIWPVAFALPNALRASGDAKFTMVVSIISMWTCRIGFSYILGRYLGMGVMGVWVAMVIDWVARAAFFITRFVRGKWKSINIIK